MKILLVRTGQTTWDAEGRVRGRVDVPLTEAGRAETAATADALAPYRPEAVYGAPGEADRDTAAILAKRLRLRRRTLEGLANIDSGLWQGMRWDDVLKRHPRAYRQLMEAPMTVTPPEGESLGEVLRRVRGTVMRLAARHNDGAVVIVCPADVCGFVRTCAGVEAVAPPQALDPSAPQWCMIEVTSSDQ